MVVIEGKLEVGHHGVAFIAAGGEEDGGPEVFEGGEVMGPVADDGVEDGADVGIETDFGVERDLGLCDVVWRSPSGG